MFDEGEYYKFVGNTIARLNGIEKTLDEHKDDMNNALSGIRIELSNIRNKFDNLPTNGGWKKPAMYAGGGGISLAVVIELVRSLFGK